MNTEYVVIRCLGWRKPFYWLFVFAVVTAGFSVNAATPANVLEKGRRIYQEGVLSSGKPLVGLRSDNINVEGAQAACINCHLRSGMGSVEGNLQVQPISARYLFGEEKALATMDVRGDKRFNLSHPPYTEDSLAAAIRTGINNSGSEMTVMMPRYELNKQDMAALTAYLHQLSSQWSPGAAKDKIHFATVIAPGVEPERQKAVLEVLKQTFAQKNANTVAPKNVGRRRHMVTAAEMVLGTERPWELHVWELQGNPDTWLKQMENNYRKQPVFAVISGISNTTWKPVQSFCESKHVPCWFPSVDLPPAEPGFYSLYFSRGVAVEASVLAKYLHSKPNRPHRVIQVYRDDYVGSHVAKDFTNALSGSGIKVEALILRENNHKELLKSLQDLTENDVVMFWLRPSDLTSLKDIAQPLKAISYFSAELIGGERGPIPESWKNTARLVYPYELPEQRMANLALFHTWFMRSKIPLVDEPVQAETFFAVDFLSKTITEMLDNLYGDYLLERARNMLSKQETTGAEELARERGRQGQPVTGGSSKRESTTIYPHLSLGNDQSFASKGAYIVRFGDGGKLVAESEWIVP